MTKPASINADRHQLYRSIGVLQWALPLILSVVAVGYEIEEHLVAPELVPETTFALGEILLFGILGPVAVATVLAYIRRLLDVQLEARSQVEQLNRGLELTVAERTRHLEEVMIILEAKNQTLALANAELHQLDDAKSEFVALVSHALRAPLTTLNGALELIQQDAERLPARVQRTLGLLIQEGARLHTLVQTILDVSRLETGKVKLNPGPLALEPLLKRATGAIMSGEPERPLLLEIRRGLPPAWADDLHIEEVVSNLVSNAVKYSPPGSPIHIGAQSSDSEVTVTVTDHGPGISSDEQQHVFEAFRRTPQSERTDVDGRGLGLYFARKLIEANGGRIWLDSPVWPDAEHPGARFSFVLPIAGETPDEQAGPA